MHKNLYNTLKEWKKRQRDGSPLLSGKYFATNDGVQIDLENYSPPFCHYLYTKAPLVCGLTFIPFCFWQNCSSFVKLHGDHECTTIFKCCQKCWFGLRSDSATVGLNIVVLKPFLCSFGLMFALFFLLENKSSQSLLSSRLQQVFLEDFSSLLLHPISPQSSQAFQDLLQRSIPIAG